MWNHSSQAAWAFAAGAGIPIMASLNGSLSRALGSAMAACVVLFAVGLVCAAAALLASGTAGALTQIIHSPWHLALGGVIVAFYILSVTILAPAFGVGNTILFVMIAQILVSAAIDHFGLFGAVVRPVGAVRATGLLLMIAGLAVAQFGAQKGPL